MVSETPVSLYIINVILSDIGNKWQPIHFISIGAMWTLLHIPMNPVFLGRLLVCQGVRVGDIIEAGCMEKRYNE